MAIRLTFEKWLPAEKVLRRWRGQHLLRSWLYWCTTTKHECKMRALRRRKEAQLKRRGVVLWVGEVRAILRARRLLARDVSRRRHIVRHLLVLAGSHWYKNTLTYQHPHTHPPTHTRKLAHVHTHTYNHSLHTHTTHATLTHTLHTPYSHVVLVCSHLKPLEQSVGKSTVLEYLASACETRAHPSVCGCSCQTSSPPTYPQVTSFTSVYMRTCVYAYITHVCTHTHTRMYVHITIRPWLVRDMLDSYYSAGDQFHT